LPEEETKTEKKWGDQKKVKEMTSHLKKKVLGFRSPAVPREMERNKPVTIISPIRDPHQYGKKKKFGGGEKIKKKKLKRRSSRGKGMVRVTDGLTGGRGEIRTDTRVKTRGPKTR